MSRFLPLFSVALIAGLAPAQTGPYGNACSVTALNPTLTLSSGRPRINTSFEITADAMTPTTPVIFWLGFSRTMWGGLTLPFRLDLVGRPDCALLASIDVLVTVPQVQYRQARLTLTVPNDPALVGRELYAQAANYLPGWDWMFTHGLALRIE